MESIEQTGRNVEEAVQAALKLLGLSREQVEVEVLAEENRGLLGIFGTSEAKVRVTPKRVPPLETTPSEGPVAGPSAEPIPMKPREPIEESELALRAKGILTEILQYMGMDATPEVTAEEPDAIYINLKSDSDLGLLIGKHGQTLEALQLIVAMMANRKQPVEARRKIILDAQGYRDRHENALRARARTAAERVKRSGREVKFEGLTPRERRIVHLELADDSDIMTRSEGEDPDRIIIIALREQSGGGRPIRHAQSRPRQTGAPSAGRPRRSRRY